MIAEIIILGAYLGITFGIMKRHPELGFWNTFFNWPYAAGEWLADKIELDSEGEK